MREVVDDSRKTYRESNILPNGQGLRRSKAIPFNGQKLETLRRSSPRKKTEKSVDEADSLMPIKPIVFNPLVTETANAVSMDSGNKAEDTSIEADNIPVLADGDTLFDSQEWKPAQE